MGSVTLCSGLRLNKLVNTSQIVAIDPTFALVDAAVWSVIETNLSVVCVCLPSMRPLLRAVLHGHLRSTAGSSARHSGNRRSHYDSTVATNFKRRSQISSPRQAMGGGINKEQRTDVNVAEQVGEDVELGYFATVTANNSLGRDRRGRDKDSEEAAESDISSVNEREARKHYTQPGSQSAASRNDLGWRRRNSSVSVDAAREHRPMPWPLGPDHSDHKNLD